jgi:isoquinoline 1-oxidoreductase subunit beta
LNSVALSATLVRAAAEGRGSAFKSEDDPRLDAAATDAALARASRVIDVSYEVPFLAHAPMEPLNATAEVQADSAQLWLSTQSQSDTQRGVAAALGLKPEQVVIHSQTAGGGFGRRLEHDFAIEAALIARAVGPGRPVKTIWSREVDMRSGRYRPAAAARVRLALDDQQLPSALRVDMAHPSLLEHSHLSLPAGRDGLDWTAGMGWLRQSYAIPALHLTWTRVEHGVPCGFWRSVGASQNTFFFESTLDRAAHSAGLDPVAYRRRLLAGSPRALAFVDALVARAGWGQPLAPGRFRGFAMSEGNRAIGGHVVEISVPEPESGRFRIERITAAIDAGWVGNPDAVKAQVMGATLFGLSAALFGEITLEQGRVVQGNFDGYPILRLAQVPPLDIVVLANGDRAAGVGEECTPSIAPALTAALFAASGQPVTRLPLTRAGWQLAD